MSDLSQRLLPQQVRVIQGDGIDEVFVGKIVEALMTRKLAFRHVAFWTGGVFPQELDRDTFAYSMKTFGLLSLRTGPRTPCAIPGHFGDVQRRSRLAQRDLHSNSPKQQQIALKSPVRSPRSQDSLGTTALGLSAKLRHIKRDQPKGAAVSDDKPTKPRLIPKAKRPDIEGPFETLMALGTHLPGTLGYIARRKLKRRHCKRAQDTFSDVLADTGAGDLCLDLGANVGEFTIRMAETGADVISFEPDPGAYEALEKAVAGRTNVTLLNKAAGHQDDTLLLHRSEKWSPDDPTAHTKSSSLVNPGKSADDANAVMVEVIDIISFIEGLDRDVRIIKMDIEGAEWAIMNRLIGHPVLNRIDCIFVETHERIDPAKYVPMFDALQDRAEQLTRPYINLYWI